MCIRPVQARFASVVLAFEFFDGGRLLAQPEADLFGIGAEDDVGKALDVLALRRERGGGVTQTRGPVLLSASDGDQGVLLDLLVF
jgi:hypothetical protein